eukprot:TRINITY_DN16943_c0_g1_i1.p1 TRINITY_DN16943_c0_g1~~TRINITY_DN16943_c0_g1_i1.p1  ORF type:complete len:290 (-),score=50.27 TRINITY_DN16943_c0_g1_i1:46-915(-)
MIKSQQQENNSNRTRINKAKAVLHSAIRNGVERIVQDVLQKHPELLEEKALKSQFTPLHLAIKANRLNLTELLVAKGANPNAPDNAGKTPIHWAATKSTPEHLRSLTKLKNIDLAVQDAKGRTPLHVAVLYGCPECIQIILDCGTEENANDVTNEGRTALLLSIRYNKVEAQRTLLASGKVKTEVKDKKGRTPLHHAVRSGLIDSVKLLIEHKADVNSTDDLWKTPLHYAAEKDLLEIAVLLTGSEANVNIEDKFRRAPLHYAVTNGFDRLAAVLTTNGADVSVRYDPK